MDIKEFDTFIIKRTCARCSYEWWPRSQETKRCPKCQTWYWRKEDEETEHAPAAPEMR